MKISLKEITTENYEAVCRLYLPDEQQEHLAPNTWSLVESHYENTHHTRAIYLDNIPVGFIMWVLMSNAKTSIWRFMVAHEHQKKGIGRASLQLAIEEIKVRQGLQEIEICYSPHNQVAIKLYASVGFQETGWNEDGDELLAVIKV